MNIKFKKQSIYIILSVILLSLAVTFIDAFIRPNYIIKCTVKIFFFLIIPFSYFILNNGEFTEFKKLFKFRWNTMLKAVAFGISVYIIILGGYFALRNIIDFSNVTNTLQQNNGITADNFIWVSLYISLMNSFVEEFFFRGFGFITLKCHVSKRFSYLFSPIMFAVYHVGMLIGMFDWFILPLLFIGLFAGGIIFNYLNDTSENIYTSWACHMFANFAINTVAFILFGII